MNNKKENNWLWLGIIIAILILVFVIFSNEANKEFQVVKKNADLERKKSLQRQKLESEKENIIRESLKRREQYNQMKQFADSAFKKIMWGIISLFIFINVIVYFFIPNSNIFNLVNWNVAVITVMSVIEFAIFFKVKGIHVRIKEEIQKLVYDRVFREKTEDYFEFMNNLDQQRLDQLENEIKQLDNPIVFSKWNQ